jgi:hypothetical protein
MEALMSLSGSQVAENARQLTSLLDKLYEDKGYKIYTPGEASEHNKQESSFVTAAVSSQKK